MNKENTLFAIIGVLLGFIAGFIFANTANQRGLSAPTAQAAQQVEELPPNHPPISGDAAAGGAPKPAFDMTLVRDAEKLAKDAPDNFDAQVKAGELNYAAQHYDEAINFWTRADKIRPGDYDTLVKLGNATYDAQKFAEAERWYAQALAKKPDEVNVRTDYGLTFMLRDPADYDRAVAEFQRSLARDPKHVQTLQNLTVAYTRKGDAANAKTTLAKLEAVAPDSDTLPRLRADIEKMNQAK
jgi:tetratricopeptide (TPR) repeat protein